MRRSGSTPHSRARRSDWRPAQLTRPPPAKGPRGVSTTRPPPSRSRTTRVTRAPVTTAAPEARRRAAIRSATAAKSTSPVSPTHSPATPAACGSSSRSSPALSRREIGEAVGAAAALQLVEPRHLPGVDRHHQLAAPPVGQPLLVEEAVEGLAAGGAQPRLRRARRVVEPGVDDPGVVAGLVGRQPLLGLEHGEAQAVTLGERQRRGQADDAAAGDDDVEAVGQGATAPSSSGRCPSARPGRGRAPSSPPPAAPWSAGRDPRGGRRGRTA